MKKIVTCLFVIILFFSVFCTIVNASEVVNENNIQNNEITNNSKGNTIGELIEQKDKELKKLEDLKNDYGSEPYGLAAYILSRIRIYSIPICLLGIAISAIYQSVIGIRKLDYQERGLHLMVTFITVLVICQVLPLVFAIIVKGWRG